MYTRVTPKREEIKLCELKPGDIFMYPEFEDNGTIFMVVEPNSSCDITIDFEKGSILAVNLDDGELWDFCRTDTIYKVNGSFEGVY